jgi:hypothetical protein
LCRDQSRAARLAAAARAHVAAHYDVGVVVPCLERLYLDVLARRGNRGATRTPCQ